MSGEVSLVEDGEGRRLALKKLKGWQHGIHQEEALASFKREFSIMKDLHHAHIAHIVDFGRDDEGRYYFTAEYIEGQDLFSATEAMSAQEIEVLIVQTLRALGYLHSQGVLHLDIKPANVLLTPDHQIKLIDFGLSGERRRGEIAGTPSYIPPEILYGETPDMRADLYSLGVLWYTCLTRQNPFRGPTTAETLSRQKKLQPPPPSRRRPDLPSYLDPILERLLAKNRAERYAASAQVIRDINLLSSHHHPIETIKTLLSYLPEEGALVGREKELQRARELCLSLKNHAKRSEKPQLMILGPKGIGKTRLLLEIKHDYQLNDLSVLWMDASNDRTGSLKPLDHPSILLIDNADQLTATAEETLFEALKKTGHSPLILLAAESACSLPLLGTLCAHGTAETMTLEPFTEPEVSRYLVALTGLQNPPAPLVQALFQRTEGHPLFISEILKSLIRQGLLFDPEGRWHPAAWEDFGVDFSKLTIPATILQLMEAAFRSLPADRQQMIALLALLGRPLATHEIEDLVERGLLEKAASRELPRFRNPLWGEIVSQILTDSDIKKWHDRLGDWLENSSPEEALIHRGSGSDTDRACAALAALIHSRLNAGRGDEAIPLLNILLSRLPEERLRDRTESLLDLGEAHLQSGALHKAREIFEEAFPLLNRIDNRDDNILFKIDLHEKLCTLFLKLLKTVEAQANVQAGLELLRNHGNDPVRKLILENDQGQVWCQEGHTARALDLFIRTDKAWQALSATDQDRVINNDLGFVFLLHGDIPKAIATLENQLLFFTRLSKRYPEARCHYNLAEAYSRQERWDDAMTHYEQAVRLARPLRSHDLLLRSYNGLGNIQTLLKKPDDAIEHYTRALAVARKIADHSSEAAVHVNLGLLYQETHDIRSAEHHLLGAIQNLQSMTTRSAYDVTYLARSHLEMASLLRIRGEPEQARHHLQNSEKLLSGHPDLLKPLAVWIEGERKKLAAPDPAARDVTYLSSIDPSRRLSTRLAYESMTTRSKKMEDVFRLLDRVTDTTLSVLILGETGTGKELIARALHENSVRKDKPFVAINCGAVPAELMESELFGHQAGAFTGAARDRIGLCEAANGGTMFLDEIGEMPAALQTKLLRFLQEKEFRRVGEIEVRHSDVRIVAATHRDVRENVSKGEFREDLFFRLAEIEVHLPSLRERREDIPLLTRRFLKEYGEETGDAKPYRIERELLRRLMDYDWPGNIRELENFVRVACALADGHTLRIASLPSHSPLAGKNFNSSSLSSTSEVPLDANNFFRPHLRWADYEKLFIAHAYRHHRYRAVPAARAIGISAPTLYKKIREWTLEDADNPLYKDPLHYDPSVPLKVFQKMVFLAARAYHKKPYTALRALGVSQGHFYRVIKTDSTS